MEIDLKVRTRIKICGMTNKAEVKRAVAAGVDALGFIFVKESPRYISPEDAREIISELPPFVDSVGVFMNEEAEVVDEIVHYCGLTVIQLHGDESPEYCQQMGGRVVKAFRVGPSTVAADLELYQEVVMAFLLDTYQPGVAGGTGKSFDWSLVEKLAPVRPVILAGGLAPDNIADAIKMVHPYGVDVNSGVETEPGRKDMIAISRLVAEVVLADKSRFDERSRVQEI